MISMIEIRQLHDGALTNIVSDRLTVLDVGGITACTAHNNDL